MRVTADTSLGPLLDAVLEDARRAAASGDMRAIERATTRLDAALHRLPPGSRARARVECLAAETALVGHRLAPTERDLARRAEELAALEPSEPSERRLRDLTLARLHGELGLGRNEQLLDHARGLLRELSSDEAGGNPLRRDAALVWGDLAWRARRWPEAAMAYEQALDLRTAAIDNLMMRHAREQELRPSSEAAPRAALAHARAGDASQAAETIERGRAMLMNPRVFVDKPDPRAQARAAIERAAQDAAIVYLIAEQETGAAILVDERGATTLELPGLTTGALSERLEPVVGIGDGRIAAGSDVWFFETGAWLWTAAMEPVLDAVERDELIVVACGLTSTLPLHAAWRPGVARPRYAFEDLVIRYAPNASWAAPEGAVGPATYRTALAVGNPRNSLPALRYAEAEITAIPASLSVERLAGRQASRPEVLSRWADFDIVHFACHGKASAEVPLDGGVFLADDGVLTAREVIDREFTTHPLVILSACETAVIGAQLPDEVVSLQSAFLAAGASGVLATLWPVSDEQSARLIEYFYRELVERGRSPARALRASQRRLAAATAPRGPAPTWAAFTYAGR